MTTWLADEHILYGLTAALWMLSRFAGPRPRAHADHLAVCVMTTGILPHLMKGIIDQKRPDRYMVHGPRNGIPKSVQADDAFPSGHANAPRRIGAPAATILPHRARWA